MLPVTYERSLWTLGDSWSIDQSINQIEFVNRRLRQTCQGKVRQNPQKSVNLGHNFGQISVSITVPAPPLVTDVLCTASGGRQWVREGRRQAVGEAVGVRQQDTECCVTVDSMIYCSCFSRSPPFSLSLSLSCAYVVFTEDKLFPFGRKRKAKTRPTAVNNMRALFVLLLPRAYIAHDSGIN